MPHARVSPPHDGQGVGAGPDQPAQASSAAASAAAVIALQATGLIAAGLWLMVRALGHDAKHRGSTEVLGAMSVVLGIGVLYLARAVRRRNGRVRAPLLILEIICLPISVTIWQGGRWYVGLPLALSAVLALGLAGRAGVLSPSAEDLD
jgi:hypothetical protein